MFDELEEPVGGFAEEGEAENGEDDDVGPAGVLTVGQEKAEAGEDAC